MRSWSSAWSDAAATFWSTQQPGEHFRTSVSVPLARRMLQEIGRVDERLGHPAELMVVDVGAGDGSLLAMIADLASPDLRRRLRLVGVDLRPCDDPELGWIIGHAPGDVGVAAVRGLIMAHEWLDEIPCDVIERDDDGDDRLVLTADDGTEELGPRLSDTPGCAQWGVDAAAARAWMRRWWPLTVPGQRAEIGSSRDRAWQWLTSLLAEGAVIATDYGHVREERERRYVHGTLVGYRDGHLVQPKSDGTVNLTAHVAVDSCTAQVPGTTLSLQREMLRDVVVPFPPSHDGPAFARVLAERSRLATLRDPNGAGAFTWLRKDG